MNKKFTYRWTSNEDYSIPNNNYAEETEHIITDGVYDFEDWLSDSLYKMYAGNYTYERDGDKYYILDGCNERTGEVYWLINEEDTDEEV